jgi:hypothetical protein
MLEGERFTTLSNCEAAFNSNLRVTEFSVAIELHAHIPKRITRTRHKFITKTLIPGNDRKCTIRQFMGDYDGRSTSRHSGMNGLRTNIIGWVSENIQRSRHSNFRTINRARAVFKGVHTNCVFGTSESINVRAELQYGTSTLSTASIVITKEWFDISCIYTIDTVTIRRPQDGRQRMTNKVVL